jgi:hypothetical protein
MVVSTDSRIGESINFDAASQNHLLESRLQPVFKSLTDRLKPELQRKLIEAQRPFVGVPALAGLGVSTNED